MAPKKFIKKIKDSKDCFDELSQVWPPRTPSHLGPHTPTPTTTASIVSAGSQDLFASQEEDNPRSQYSEEIPDTPGAFSVESSVLAVPSQEEPSEFYEDAQDLSVMGRDLFTEQTQESQRPRSTEDEGETTDEGHPLRVGRNVTLSRRVEVEIVEWLKENPYLYSRGHPHYKNKEKKQRAMDEHAKKIGLTREELARWIHTKRTRFGKLTRDCNKSGSGQLSLSDLDRWTMKLFEFMRPHIVRQKPTKTLGIGQVCKKKCIK